MSHNSNHKYMEIQLEGHDHNLLKFQGEVFLEENIVVGLEVIQKYESMNGDHFTPPEINYNDPEITISKIYLNTEQGEEINIWTTELEDHIKQSLIINH